MNQLEINKRFADFIRLGRFDLTKPSHVYFEGKLGIIITPQHGEYLLMQLEFGPSGWATKNECVAYVNFHDTHG